MPWLDMFKIRYSWGKVGNDNTGYFRFPYLYTINETPGIVWNWGTDTAPFVTRGYHYTQIASPDVTWEIAKKTDIGLDFVAFKNKLSFTVDYYHEKRSGIFMERRFLPLIVGLESNPWANVGVVKSWGVDGNFEYKQKIKQVNCTLRGNITYCKNSIVDKDEENTIYPYQYEKGYRIGQQRGLVALGLFKDYDDIRNSPKQQFGTVQPGDIKYKDVNGDGVVNWNDQVAIGATSTPSLIYGVGASISWKGFDFNVHFQGAGKSTFQISGKTVYAFSEGRWGNILKGMTDGRWISKDISGTEATENPNATYPRLSYGGNLNNYRASSFWLRDGRYLRLKNLDIGYTLPKSLLIKLHLTSVRIYVSGQNLYTWSEFKNWDPELGSGRGEIYPITKSLTAGMQITL